MLGAVLRLATGLLVATMLGPAAEPPPPAPGGYWSIGEQRERRREPPDGEDELTVGSILLSLGLLRAGAAGVTVWLAQTPSRCPAREPEGCDAMALYGWLGFGEGGLMVGTGLTYMIIGAVRRERHRRWASGANLGASRPQPGRNLGWLGPSRRVEIGPWWPRADPAGGGLQLRLRF